MMMAAAVHSAACSDGKLLLSARSGRRSGTAFFNISVMSLIARRHSPALIRRRFAAARCGNKLAAPTRMARPASARRSQSSRSFFLRRFAMLRIAHAECIGRTRQSWDSFDPTGSWMIASRIDSQPAPDGRNGSKAPVRLAAGMVENGH